MSEVIVYTNEQLKQALKSNASKIIVRDEKLAKRLLALQTIKKKGPLAIAAVVAAVPLLIATGGLATPGLIAAVGIGGAVALPSVAWLAVAFGGIILTSLLTDWEVIKIFGVVELRREPKKQKQKQ